MKDQIEKLKQELREFIELSKTITQGEWESANHCYIQCGGEVIADLLETHEREIYKNTIFIARSRNISPALAECLLSQIEWMEQYAIPVESANQQLQQILNLWEESK
jgi:hypothetical protein